MTFPITQPLISPQSFAMENSKPLVSSSAKPKFKRYFHGDGGEATLDFTPVTLKKVENTHVDENEFFWSSGDVHAIGESLLVKRYYSNGQDFVYLQRLNSTAAASRFKFPSGMILILLVRMKEIIDKVGKDEDGKFFLETIPPYNGPTKDFSADSFWKGKELIKIQRFHMMPYHSFFGLQFRLFQEVPEDFHREYMAKDGKLVPWKGAQNSISFSVFKGLYKALVDINNDEDEDG